MIKDLENKEVDIKGLLDLDQDAVSMSASLLAEIAEAKSKNYYGGSYGANYNTYDFSFADDSVSISGIAPTDAVIRVKLSDFIQELKRLSDPHASA